MGFEGFSPMRKNSSREDVPKVPDASEVASVYNELQIQMAKRQYRDNHPDQSEGVSGNEVMGEWITDGSAAKFADEFGSSDIEELRKVLRKIKNGDSETLH